MIASDMLSLAAILSPIVIGFGGWLLRVEIRLNQQQQRTADATHQLERIGEKIDKIEVSQNQLLVNMARIEEQIRTLFSK